MSSSATNMIHVGSAITVVVAALTFWVAMNEQAARLAASVESVRKSLDDTRTTVQGTRDAVMLLSGKVDGLSGTIERNTHFLESLDERVRSLETSGNGR